MAAYTSLTSYYYIPVPNFIQYQVYVGSAFVEDVQDGENPEEKAESQEKVKFQRPYGLRGLVVVQCTRIVVYVDEIDEGGCAGIDTDVREHPSFHDHKEHNGEKYCPNFSQGSQVADLEKFIKPGFLVLEWDSHDSTLLGTSHRVHGVVGMTSRLIHCSSLGEVWLGPVRRRTMFTLRCDALMLRCTLEVGTHGEQHDKH